MSTENATSQVSASVPAPSAPSVTTSSNPSFSGGAASSATSVKAPSAPAEAAPTAIDPKSLEQTPPTYTPNLKFKVYGEEKEFDPLFKDLVKDLESEKKIREFHEKAFGLDNVKTKHEKLKTDFAEIDTKYKTLDKSLNQLSAMLKAGDMKSFLDVLNIPDEMVFEYVKKELEKRSASPEQRAVYEEQERIRRENLRLQQQNEELQTRYSNESLQARAFELDQALAGPDVQKVATIFDAKMGSGAFRDEVIKRGIAGSQMSGKEISVQQAISETVGLYSKWIQDQTPSSMPVAQPQVAAQPKPSLPNVSASSASPLKKGPRSIEDLRKLAARSA